MKLKKLINPTIWQFFALKKHKKKTQSVKYNEAYLHPPHLRSLDFLAVPPWKYYISATSNDLRYLKLKPWAINITESTIRFAFVPDVQYTAKLLKHNNDFFLLLSKRRQIIINR